MQLLVGSVEDADLRSGSKLWLGMKENSMFILLMFILAYRYHRAGANGIGQTLFRNLVTIARSTGEHRGQMANHQCSTVRPV